MSERALVLHEAEPFQIPAIIADVGPEATKRFFEFFTVPIRNKNTRAAYYQAIGQFLDWCQRAGFTNLEDIEPIHVAAYIESHKGSAATIKQHMAAIRMMFSWLTEKGILAINRPGKSKRPNSLELKARRRRSAPKKFKKSSLPSIRVMSSAFGTKHFLLLWRIRLPGSERS